MVLAAVSLHRSAKPKHQQPREAPPTRRWAKASPMGFVVPSARVKAQAVKAQVPQVRVTGRGHQTAPRITAATAAATLRRAMALEATRHQVQAVAAEVPASVGDRLVMVSPAAHVIAAWEVATLDMEAPEVSLPVASASPECQQVVLAQIKVYRQREGRVCRLVVLAGSRTQLRLHVSCLELARARVTAQAASASNQQRPRTAVTAPGTDEERSDGAPRPRPAGRSAFAGFAGQRGLGGRGGAALRKSAASLRDIPRLRDVLFVPEEKSKLQAASRPA